jgi:hypothetical protein
MTIDTKFKVFVVFNILAIISILTINMTQKFNKLIVVLDFIDKLTFILLLYFVLNQVKGKKIIKIIFSIYTIVNLLIFILPRYFFDTFLPLQILSVVCILIIAVNLLHSEFKYLGISIIISIALIGIELLCMTFFINEPYLYRKIINAIVTLLFSLPSMILLIYAFKKEEMSNILHR